MESKSMFNKIQFSLLYPKHGLYIGYGTSFFEGRFYGFCIYLGLFQIEVRFIPTAETKPSAGKGCSHPDIFVDSEKCKACGTPTTAETKEE